MVQLAEKTWLLNTPLRVLPLQCPTSSFSDSPDAGNRTHPISADPRGLKSYTREREQIGKGALLPFSHQTSGWRLFVQQANSMPFPQLPATV